MQNILIATPCLDQKVDAYFVHSLCESIKLGLKYDLDIRCVFLANESILPMARNELFYLAVNQNYDQMVFIDDDELWDPKVLINIILSPEDVITVPVVNKTDTVKKYNTLLAEPLEINANGYHLVEKTGTGFLKISNKCFMDLWNSNVEVEFRGKILRSICEYGIGNGYFIGEDIMLCNKIKNLGYKIWSYSNYTVPHIGNKIYTGDFTQTLI